MIDFELEIKDFKVGSDKNRVDENVSDHGRNVERKNIFAERLLKLSTDSSIIFINATGWVLIQDYF